MKVLPKGAFDIARCWRLSAATLLTRDVKTVAVDLPEGTELIRSGTAGYACGLFRSPRAAGPATPVAAVE
jgi:hypothetical protein